MTALVAIRSANASGGYARAKTAERAFGTTIADARGDGAGSNAVHRVTLFGNAPDLSHADRSAGIAQCDSLDSVDGQSVTVTTAKVARLSDRPEDFVADDAPMAPTGAGTTSAPVASFFLARLDPHFPAPSRR